MSADDPRILALAAAISDGEPVEWPDETHADEKVRAAIRSLRIVAEVAAAHRRSGDRAGAEMETVTEPTRTEPTLEAASFPLRPVPSLPGFKIARQLGEGGMGIVYEAEQLHPHRPVALKVVRAGLHADAVTLALFEREMQTLARFKHPGIAAIYESGTTPEGLPFYTMELVRGETLSDHLKRRGGTSETELPYRLSLFRKICEAVAYAHQRGIVHRDLKPANVLVLRDPASPTSFGLAVSDIKVLDFGLARIADEGGASMVSELGSVKGTLAYMSPEQTRGNPDEIDLRSDVYSLGVMLYEIVTGHLPHDISGKSFGEAVQIIEGAPPKPIVTTWSGSTKLDDDVRTIIGKALEKEPVRRYATVQALAEDIQRFLTDQPIQARPPSAMYQIRKLVVRHKLPFAFGAVLAAVLVASTIGLAIQARRIAVARDQARQQAETASRVSEFLVSLFRVSDPGESRGNTVTAREILDTGSDRIRRELKDDPLVRARMLDTIGNVYRSLGLYSRAEPLLEEGLRTREEALGPKHPDVAESHNSLAHSLIMRGNDVEAEHHAQQALDILSEAHRGDGVDAAWSLYFLALSRTNQGDYAGARGRFEQARALFEKELGHESLPVAWCLEDLGRSLEMAGDTKGALAPSEEALRIKEQVLGDKHPDVAIGLNNVGYLHMHMGDLNAARQVLDRALTLAESTYGPDHRFTGIVLESLGELDLERGDLAGARTVLERAHRIFEKQVEPDAYDSVLVEVVLARVLTAQGEMPAAGRLFESALASQERTKPLGAEATTLYRSYADYLRKRGRASEAERYEQKAREVGPKN